MNKWFQIEFNNIDCHFYYSNQILICLIYKCAMAWQVDRTYIVILQYHLHFNKLKEFLFCITFRGLRQRLEKTSSYLQLLSTARVSFHRPLQSSLTVIQSSPTYYYLHPQVNKEIAQQFSGYLQVRQLLLEPHSLHIARDMHL